MSGQCDDSRYNMVLLHPQKPTQENDESWTRKGEKSEMLDFYKDWNDTVKNLLSCKLNFLCFMEHSSTSSSSHRFLQMSLKEMSWNGR